MVDGKSGPGPDMAGASPDSAVRDPHSWCADELRRLDPDRWMTALFAPEGAVRNALFCLYAFNLELSRIRAQVREPMLGQIRLQWWREALEGALAGKPRNHSMAQALSLSGGAIGRAPLMALIDGREIEYESDGMATAAHLLAYCDQTAGAVLRGALQALDVEQTEQAAQAAKAAGEAYALAGLLRAVPYHAARGQVWLPLDLLAAQGLSRDHLVQSRLDGRLVPVVRALHDVARERLAEARAASRRLPRGALPALLVCALADLYLKRLAKAGFDVEHPSLGVGVPRRQLCVWWAATIGRA